MNSAKGPLKNQVQKLIKIKEGKKLLRKENNNNFASNKNKSIECLKKNEIKIQKLMRKLKYSQQMLNIDYSDDKSSSFEEAINAFYWNSKTLKNIKSLFKQYQDYINKKYQNNESQSLEDSKIIETDEFFKENNIVDFLQNNKKFESSTFNNRLGIFRRVIRIMTKNPLWDYAEHSVQEKKTKNEKILSPTQKLYLLKDINSEKSLDLLILFALLFDLGFNIYQVSRIKVKDIYFNQEIIEISYKGHRKVRKINFEMAQILKEHINKQKLNASNYLIYNEFIETKCQL